MACPDFSVSPGATADVPASFGGSANRVTLAVVDRGPSLPHFGAVRGQVALLCAGGVEAELTCDVWTPGQIVVVLPDTAPAAGPYRLRLTLARPPAEDCGPVPFFVEGAQPTGLIGLVVRIVTQVLALLVWFGQPLRRYRASLLELSAGDTWVQDVSEQGSRSNTTMTVTLRNLAGEPVTVDRALTLFCYTSGGFVGNADFHRATEADPFRFVSWPNPIPATTGAETQSWLRWPSNHVVHAVVLSRPPRPVPGFLGLLGRREQAYQEIAARAVTKLDARASWLKGRPAGLTASPPAALLAYEVGFPVYVTLMTPIEAIDASEITRAANGTPVGTVTQRRVTVYGQVIGLTGDAVDVREAQGRFFSAAGVGLHHDALSIESATTGIDADGNPIERNPAHRQYVPAIAARAPIVGRFYWSDVLPAGAAAALGAGLEVEVRITYVLGGRTRVATQRAPVAPVTAEAIRFPLARPEWDTAVWGCGNGPAAAFLTGHNQGVATRYAYDFWLSIDGNGRRRKADGTFEDGTLRSHSLTWDQPLIAVAPGDVYYVRNTEIDHNSGRSADETAADYAWDDTRPAGGNIIVVRHDLGGAVAFTVYAHVMRDSQRVAEGDAVAEGAELGRIGNSGNSSGPHLHFEYWFFTDAAEIQAIAPRFHNVYAPGLPAERVTGVPRNGTQLQVS